MCSSWSCEVGRLNVLAFGWLNGPVFRMLLQHEMQRHGIGDCMLLWHRVAVVQPLLFTCAQDALTMPALSSEFHSRGERSELSVGGPDAGNQAKNLCLACLARATRLTSLLCSAKAVKAQTAGARFRGKQRIVYGRTIGTCAKNRY